MPIRVQCENCQERFKVDDRHAGKVAKCPSCKGQLLIPGSDLAATSKTVAPTNCSTRGKKAVQQPKLSPGTTRGNVSAGVRRQVESEGLQRQASQQDIANKLLDGFQGPIKRTRPAITYQLAAAVVALVMVLLPMVYILLIGLVGYGVYYHAVNHTGIMSANVRGRAQFFLLLAYLAPMVCGCILVAFMIKPLFFRSTSHARTRSLKRESEPLLFAFVDRICDAVGATQPKRIDLDCQVNASARFRRGLMSMFGNDLVLTIGLPLVAGLNTRQFAGVLAHEFGHFSQGAGMRLTYVIRSISHWLLRVVYQRDAADEWLSQTADSLDIRIGWIFHLAKLFVWITRGILWVLMQMGNVVGSYLLRQMEYDADRYEARLVGGEAFAQTARKLQVLAVATRSAFADLGEFYREGRLGDDLPQLIISKAKEFPKETVKEISDFIENTPTGWMDTHPSDRDRIASAQREQTDGVFKVELPATVLFQDFGAQAKNTTWEFYRQQFGESLQRSQLFPVSVMFAKQEKEQAARASLDRFFQENWSVASPLTLSHKYSQAPKNPQATLLELRSTRQLMLKEMEVVEPLFESQSELLDQFSKAERIRYFGRAELKIKVDGKYYSQDYSKEAKRIEDSAKKQLISMNRSLETYQNLASQRVGLALQLLHVSQVARRIANSRELRKQSTKLLQAYSAMGNQVETLFKVACLHGVSVALVGHLPGNESNSSLIDAIGGLAKQVFPSIKLLHSSWSRCPYPYDHVEQQITLGKYLIPELPISDDIGSILQSCDHAVEASLPLYVRLLGDLAFIAESVETAVGFPQLPDPDSSGDL